MSDFKTLALFSFPASRERRKLLAAASAPGVARRRFLPMAKIPDKSDAATAVALAVDSGRAVKGSSNIRKAIGLSILGGLPEGPRQRASALESAMTTPVFATLA